MIFSNAFLRALQEEFQGTYEEFLIKQKTLEHLLRLEANNRRDAQERFSTNQ